MISILIVEDEPIIAKDLAYTLKDLGYELSGICSKHQEVLAHLGQHQSDLTICDIHLEGDDWDGVRIAREIRRIQNQPIIFLTAMADSATINRAAEVNPDAYLVKPFEERTLYAAIELAIHKFSSGKKAEPEAIANSTQLEQIPFIAGNFFIKDKKRLVKVNAADIYWIKADGAYSQLASNSQQFLLSTNLGGLEEKLRGHFFIRVHRSYLVNFQHIDAIEEDVLYIGNERIPIGKIYREEFYRRLQQL
jgi:DNA-binding LytR/AlgR family response regulator